jgi:hypothetical protein
MADAMPEAAAADGAEDGGVRYMGKEAIVFFDKLGFGWVVDSKVLQDVKLGILIEEDLPSRSLIQMIENILSEKHIR